MITNIMILLLTSITVNDTISEEPVKYNKLTPAEEQVIIHKGTERPFSGELLNNKTKGTYTCKQCDAPLYKSDDKFDSGCGWPSFDDEIPSAIKRQTDADGRRTEILCANCGAHLGHIFTGEQLTDKNNRHCVNSISMNFVPDTQKTAYFAAGCFWGVEHFFKETPGVISTDVGYMGGHTKNPSYQDVCYAETGHAEAVKVVYNSEKTSYEELVKLFFEIHDFTQVNRQGPDIGEQYRSAIFYTDKEQKQTARKIKKQLEQKEYKVATKIEKSRKFWMGEDFHQDYYDKTGKQPYCHFRRKIFNR
ncbi:MAG: bifunctional methionine sulfoxide reductase B/A protein [Fidelibacterota bacterium]